MYGCIFCTEVTATSQTAIDEHQRVCVRRMVQCEHCKEYNVPNVQVGIEPGDYAEMQKQVAEIHAFVKGIAGALNNPMVQAMMPPQMRGMMGG